MKRTTTVLSVTALAAVAVSLPLAGCDAGSDSAQPAPVAQTAGSDEGLGLAAGEKATAAGATQLSDGSKVTRYDRTYQGLPVVNGHFAAVQPRGNAQASTVVVGKQDVTLPSTKPGLTPAQAAAKAPIKAQLDGAKLSSATKTLKVYVDEKGQSHLAYDVFIQGTGTNADDVAKHLYVDAHTGAFLGKDSEIYAGKGDGHWDKDVTFGTKQTPQGYTLQDEHGNRTLDLDSDDGTSGPGTPLFDQDDTWGGNDWVQAQAVDAQKGVELTYDFYQKTYNRAGIWNTGKGAPVRIRYKKCLENASWNNALGVMNIGEGKDCKNPLGELDVMAHEMSHGVTGSTAKLQYQLESGGLNESMSDIFATMTEFYANLHGDSPDYHIGELLDLYGTGRPLRWMDKPSKDGKSYDCWDPKFAQKDPSTGKDMVNVHYSSGPMNHAFYLMAEGSGAKTISGVSYDSPTCNNSSVSPIGRDKAGKIVYTALTSPTTRANSTYKMFRDELVKAAKSLYGKGSAECKGVQDAMSAINVEAGSETCENDSPTSTPTTTSTGGDVTVLTNGVPATASATAFSDKTFSIEVPQGATNLVVTTSGGTGDADLYVRAGAKPTDTQYDCRPYAYGTAETCTIAQPKAGTYYVRVRALRGYTNVSVKATYEGGSTSTTTSTSTDPTGTVTTTSTSTTNPTATTTSTSTTPTSGPESYPLGNGAPVTVSAAGGVARYYSFQVPAGTGQIVVGLAGGTGNADLSVMRGSADSRVLCSPAKPAGEAEWCSVQSPRADTYYVKVEGREKFRGAQLTATWR